MVQSIHTSTAAGLHSKQSLHSEPYGTLIRASPTALVWYDASSTTHIRPTHTHTHAHPLTTDHLEVED